MLRNLENFLAEIEISWCFHDTISLVPLLITLVEKQVGRRGGEGWGGDTPLFYMKGVCASK